MKNIIITLITILILGACSDEPTSKYANAEECAFKESKDCEDKSCSSLAYSYCEKSFEVKASKEKKLQAKELAKEKELKELCRDYKNMVKSCATKCRALAKGEDSLEYYKGLSRSEYYKKICLNNGRCTEAYLSEPINFIKSKCN
jgi:hypothetical protein